jgi:hypothetical protein
LSRLKNALPAKETILGRTSSVLSRLKNALPAKETVLERTRKVTAAIRRYAGIAFAALLVGFGRAKTFIMASRRNQIAGGIAALVIVVLLVVIIVLSGGGDNDDQETGGPSDNANTSAGSSGGGNASGAAPRVIAWENRQAGGRLLLLQTENKPKALFTAQGNTHVQRCGHFYTLPDQHALIVFAGGEQGDLVVHPLNGGDPTVIGQTARLTCAGPDELQVVGNRITYLKYDTNTPRGFRVGNLVIYNLANQQETVALDQAAAFEMVGGDAIALRFYTGGGGSATEADVDRWGDGNIQNIGTLTPQKPADRPEAACVFVSGDLVRIQSDIWVLLGESCDPGGSHWRLARVPMKGGSLTEIASGPVGGGFYPDNFSAQIFPAVDGSAALVAVPSGLERHIVQLIWVTKDGTQTPVIEFALADRVGLPTVEGRHLQLSPDKEWLAVVPVTRNGAQSLRLIDLSRPGSEGQELVQPGGNEQIFDYRWGPGGRLYYIAGTANNNALYVAVPGSEATRITRGQFSALEPDADGRWIAVAEWVPDPKNAAKQRGSISLINLNGDRTLVWRGREADTEILPLGVE